MEGVEASAENGSHHNNPDNIYVELNNQPSKLLQTVKELKDGLQTMKIDHERILELNHILLNKIHNRGKDKRNVFETDSKTVSYKHKGKRVKYSNSESFLEVNARSHKGRYKYKSESSKSDSKPRSSINPMRNLWGIKKIKPPMFNEEVEKG